MLQTALVFARCDFFTTIGIVDAMYSIVFNVSRASDQTGVLFLQYMC